MKHSITYRKLTKVKQFTIPYSKINGMHTGHVLGSISITRIGI